MELFFELLLTAAASLLVAFLLAKLFAANDPRPVLHDRVAGPAAVIAEEKVEEEEAEEERIIEVDEVRVKGASADVAAPMVSEEWVEVEKAPAVVAVRKAEVLVQEEGVPERIAPELFLGAVLVKEEGEVGKKQCDLTSAASATEAAIEAKLRDLGAEAAPEKILDVELEKESVPQHDLGAAVAASEILGAGLQNQEVQAIEAAEVKQHHLVAGAAPAEVLDAELEEECAQAIEVSPHELAREIVPGEVLDLVFEKQEEQVIEVNQHELAAEVAPGAILNVALSEKELKEQPVDEVVDVHDEVQHKEEAKCEVHPVDQQEQLASKEELVVRKTDDLQVSQEGNSNDKVVVQLPEEELALLEMPEDEARAYMELEEWEGIERSEVEKRFGAAAAFAASDAGATALSKLECDVQLQLQGLLKVAVDGPCYDSTQPLTLRPSSRAKWVAWQKLGDMHPEIAMEKYMNLLSEIIPGWMGEKSLDTKKHEADGDSERPILTTTAYTSDQHNNQGNEDSSTSMDEGPLTSPPIPEKGQSSDVPAG